MKNIENINKTVCPALLLLFLFGVVAGCLPDSGGSAASNNTDKIFTVRKSDLIIGTLLRGSANAKEKHKLFPEAAFKNTLTWIEEENTRVKKGDVVIKFEIQDLLDDIEKRELKIESLRKSLDLRNEERRILLSENQSSLRVANDSVISSEESYARYYKYDGKKEKEGMESGVKDKKKSFEKAREEYRKSADEISNTIYEDEDAKADALEKLETLKSSIKQQERAYKDSGFKLRIFKKYTYPNTLTDKKNKLEQSVLNLDKVKIRAASMVIQKDNEIQRVENELENAIEELARVKSYRSMMEITAPVDGILVYGDVDRRHDKVSITVGMDCGRKRVLATIPEMDNLVVNFELPEQFHHRVQKDAKVIITPDSMPTLKLTGHVSEIAVVPVHQIHWDRSSPKIYHAVIKLDEQNEKFVSGMNVEVEIIEEIIENAVNVPVEAVFEEDGEYFVYRKTASNIKKQIVGLGQSTDQYVHITEGLKAGDEVCLYSPYE